MWLKMFRYVSLVQYNVCLPNPGPCCLDKRCLYTSCSY